MRAESIAKYLQPFRITRRWTTFNGAFQLALAVHDTYDSRRVARLMQLIGQDAGQDLVCVYCKAPATTWDHLHGTVRDKRYAGYGNRIFNLVPACDWCNERKGNKHWADWLEKLDAKADPKANVHLTAVDKENESECYPWSRIVNTYPELATAYETAIHDARKHLETMDELARKIREQIVEELSARASTTVVDDE